MHRRNDLSKLGLLVLLLALSTWPGLSWAGPAAPDPAALDPVGQIGGLTWAIALQGNYAYVGIGPRLVVFDVGAPAAPTPVGQTSVFPRLVYKVAVAGDYAYVTDEEDLYVVDIHDPARPTVVGTAATPGYARGVAVAPSGSHVYVGDSYDLRVYDVSAPASPVEVGMLTFSPMDVARSIAVAGEYAYAVGWTGGLHVVHTVDPAAPLEVGTYDTPGMDRDVAVAGQYAYIAADGLIVVNVSDPAHPVLAGSYTIPGALARSVTVGGSYAYVGGYDPLVCSLHVVNVNNPAHPAGVGYLDVPGTPVGVAVAGSHVFVADDLDLLAVDVANPAQPFVVALYQKTPLAHGVALAGDYAYVADHDFGLRVVDAADPASLAEVGFYDSPGNALDVAVRGDYAYLAAHNSGLRVIRVSDPAHPAEVGAYDPDAGQAFRLVLAGDYAYLADYDHNSLRIIDVSNPANPFPAGSYAAPFPVKAVAVGETLLGGRRYAYLAEYEQKTMGSDSYLRVVDVTDPAHPASVGVLHNLAGAAFDLAVVEGAGGTRYIYLADGYLNVIDVTDPTSPTQTLMMPAGYDRTYEGVAVAGNRAYFAYGNGGLTVWDITDPALPTQLAVTGTPLNARDVAVREDAVMIAAWTGGLVAFAETELRVAPAAITWLAEVGGDDPGPRTVQVESSGRPLAWTATISPTVGWLAATPLSGTTAAEVVLTAGIAGLGVGQYSTTLVITAEGVPGSPQAIPVTLRVVKEIYNVYLPLVSKN